MKKIFFGLILLVSFFVLLGCVDPKLCGNGICETGETYLTCSQDCPTPPIEQHTACQNNACVQVAGIGVNECSVDANCVTSVFECGNGVCDINIWETPENCAQDCIGGNSNFFFNLIVNREMVDYLKFYSVGQFFFINPIDVPNPKRISYEVSTNNQRIYSGDINCLTDDCSNMIWVAKNGVTLGRKEYSIRLLLDSNDGRIYEKDTNFSIDFRDTNLGLCTEVFQGHNNVSSLRKNIIVLAFADLNKPTFFYSEECNNEVNELCRSEFSSNNANGNIADILDNNYLKVKCFANDELLGSLTASIEELNLSNSLCRRVYPNDGEIVLRYARGSLDLEERFSGLFSMDPFRSNKDKFNFWVVNKIETINNCNVESLGSCSDEERLLDTCVLPNKHPILVVDGPIGNSGTFSANNLTWGSFPDHNFDSFIFLHEVGHQFGLMDEYVNNPGSTSTVEVHFANCYAGPNHTREECLENAQWKDFIGRGCGDPYLIDCLPEDQNYVIESLLEIGCFEGCGYAEFGIFRPTYNSIMQGLSPEYVEYGNPLRSRLYGLWNEKLIEDNIKYYSDN